MSISTHREYPYKVFYDGGSTYVGDPAYAPAFGVLVIVQTDKNNGRNLQAGEDFYVWLGEEWLGVDQFGVYDYLGQPGYKRVLFGRTVDNERFYEAYRRAKTDPDFPPKTGYREKEFHLVGGEDDA